MGSSVVDVGCGMGLFLNHFHRKGVIIKGYEGSDNGIARAVIPKKKIEKMDLRKVIKNPKKYDIALSLETAEHIERDFAGVYIHNVTSVSDTVVFSSPAPGFVEPSPVHPNEQPIKYWDVMFAYYGFREDIRKTRELRKKLKRLKLPFRLKVYDTAKIYRR